MQYQLKRPWRNKMQFSEEDQIEDDGDVEDEPEDRWMQGWHLSRRNPENVCKYVSDGRRGGLLSIT